MEIAVVSNKYFNLGVMGRCGSRSLLYDLTGKSNHKIFMQSFEQFNSDKFDSNLKVLVLRHPKERAMSGSRLNLQPKFHGMPFLHLVDYEKITHILKFENLSKYVDVHKGRNDYIFTDDMIQYNPWDLKDYDYISEIELYEKFLEKPVLSVEQYQLLRDHIT